MSLYSQFSVLKGHISVVPVLSLLLSLRVTFCEKIVKNAPAGNRTGGSEDSDDFGRTDGRFNELSYDDGAMVTTPS